MSSTKKIPPIVQIGLWLVSLLVFAIGFWHTHLGVKEFDLFQSDYGSLTFAAIVLMFLLATYWFAVNGRKMALIFYILCGVIFFVCNLNYFYPAYMARTLIQNEASALNDTLQKYSNGSSSLQNADADAAVSDYLKLSSIKKQIVTEIANKGFGPNARSLTQSFNEISNKYSAAPISISNAVGSVTNNEVEAMLQKEQIEPLFDDVLGSLMLKGILKVASPELFSEGTSELSSIRDEYTPKLEKIMADNTTEYPLDSIRKNSNVTDIVSLVGKLNTAIDKINKGNNKERPILNRLNEDVHPRADKLGMIKYTFLSIKERIKEIDTWAVIILCLFIDLIVPLGIYLLLRKKEDEPDNKSLRGKVKPSSF
jgi:hypothetical protein